MPSLPASLRPFLRPTLALLAGAAAVLGLSSCEFGINLEIESVTPREITRGEITTLRIECRVDVFDVLQKPGIVKFVGLLDEPVADVEVLNGGTAAFLRVEDENLFVYTADVRVGPNASAFPLKLVFLGNGAGVDDYEILVRINSETHAPQITEVVSGSAGLRAGVNGEPAAALAIQRGSAARVEFRGLFFDATAQVFADDPAVAISDVDFSESTGSVFATVTTPANGRTGRSRFSIQTEGGRSLFTEIRVRAGTGPSGNRPELIGAYPNAVEAGTSTEITLSGNELGGADVVMEPADPNVSVSTEVIDANTLRATFNVGPSASGQVMLFAQSSGGKSVDPIFLTFAPAGTPLPRITVATPDSVAAGVATGVQVRIEGGNLAGSGFIDACYLLPNPAVGESGFSFLRYGPSEPTARDGSIVLILSVFAKSTGDPLPTGPVDLALRRSDGFTTNVLRLIIDPPPSPASGRPFISRLFPVSIRRPDERLVSITGERLTDITGIVFDQPGISATFIDAKPDGTEVRFAFDAAADAILTGDAATNFHLLTGHGRSNDASFTVIP